jgi:hypothetical protein
MYFFGFSNNRIVSIFMLLTILVLSLALSAYLPVLEGLAGVAPTGVAPTGVAPTGVAPTGVAPTGVAPTGVAPTGVAPTGVAPTGVAPTGVAPSGAQSGAGETDLNKIIAIINAQSKKPTETVEKQTINGILLNDKYTEQTINAAALKDLLKNSTQIQAIMNPILPPTPIQ